MLLTKPPVAQLEVVFHDQLITTFPLPLGRSIIGRTGDNDLQIRSKFISRHHAQIITTPISCVVEDLNSTNGIFVGTQRVKYHELGEGDVIHLGEHKLVYRDLRSTEFDDERERDEDEDEDESEYDPEDELDEDFDDELEDELEDED